MNLWIQIKQENMSTKFLKHFRHNIIDKAFKMLAKRYEICGVQPNNMEKGTHQYLQHRVAFQSR